MCGFLMNLDILIDQKAALINALGWAYEGKNKAEMFSRYLFRAHRFQTKSPLLYALNRSELMCLGYLKLFDDSFHPEDAREILEKALKIKKPQNFTLNILTAIAQ